MVPFTFVQLFRKVLTGTLAVDITGLSNAFFPYFQGTAIRQIVRPLNSTLFSSCMSEAVCLRHSRFFARTFSHRTNKNKRKQSNPCFNV